MGTLEDALRLALDTHTGQRDKAGQPYILHVMRVIIGVQDPDARIVAALHDVVEDGDRTSIGDIRDAFTPEIADAVQAITKVKGEDYESYLHRVKSNRLARMVKLADLADNMRLDRLPQVTAKDEARLEKYRRAVDVLSATSPAG